jgi:nitrilase
MGKSAPVGKRRKLMPTHAERLVGHGDGSDLTVHPTGVGRVGGPICWENYMPLAGFAMYAQGSTSESRRRLPPGR